MIRWTAEILPASESGWQDVRVTATGVPPGKVNVFGHLRARQSRLILGWSRDKRRFADNTNLRRCGVKPMVAALAALADAGHPPPFTFYGFQHADKL